MKTIEERARLNLQYEKDFLGRNLSDDMVCRAYIRGAKEQKAIDDEMLLKKWDDMTEAEYNREIAFVDWYLKNGKGAPTYSDAIEWARRELIDKAVAVLVDSGVFGLKDSCGAKAFRKAMEV